MAEKKKVKAIEQRNDVLKKIQGIKNSQTTFLDQISIFKKRAESCSDSITTLTQEEQQLADIISGADSEIARLKEELLALDGQTEISAVTDSNASMPLDTDDSAVTEIDGLSDCEPEPAVHPDTEDPSPIQDEAPEAVSQDSLSETAGDDLSAPE